jgi:hypothetical protein
MWNCRIMSETNYSEQTMSYLMTIALGLKKSKQNSKERNFLNIIWYLKLKQLDLQIVLTLSFVDNPISKYSSYGFIILVNRNIIIVKSKLTLNVTHSSIKTEYVAICEGAKEGVHIFQFLNKLGFEINQLIKLFNNNHSTISLS